jgi:hypothetical protein
LITAGVGSNVEVVVGISVEKFSQLVRVMDRTSVARTRMKKLETISILSLEGDFLFIKPESKDHLVCFISITAYE